MKKIASIIGFLLSLYSISTFSARIESIYQAEVPVSSQSVADRTAGLQQALEQVLVKVSGSSKVLDNPKIKNSEVNPDELVEEYSYGDTSAQSSGYLLKVTFDKDSIRRLLAGAGAALWSPERPLLLVWGEAESGNKPGEVLSDSSSGIPALLKKQANDRGLPIIFPMMDLNEINQISANDISNMSVASLKTASSRYNSDGILILKIVKYTGGSSIRAKLIIGNDQWDWDMLPANLNENLKIVINQIADMLAKTNSSVVSEPAVTPDEEKNQIRIKIVGLTQMNDLFTAMRYLKTLSPVARVEPIEISGNEATLSVSLRGSSQELSQEIASQGKLVSLSGPGSENFIFRWNPY